MFKYVHHVDYFVRNLDEMVAYMERTFRMKPDKWFEDEEEREAQYRVGPTLLRITEHAAGTRRAQWVEQNGPGVADVAWGADNIPEVAQQLKAKGVTLRDERGFHLSAHGYHTIHIDPKDSQGVHFQLLEGTPH